MHLDWCVYWDHTHLSHFLRVKAPALASLIAPVVSFSLAPWPVVQVCFFICSWSQIWTRFRTLKKISLPEARFEPTVSGFTVRFLKVELNPSGKTFLHIYLSYWAYHTVGFNFKICEFLSKINNISIYLVNVNIFCFPKFEKKKKKNHWMLQVLNQQTSNPGVKSLCRSLFFRQWLRFSWCLHPSTLWLLELKIKSLPDNWLEPATLGFRVTPPSELSVLRFRFESWCFYPSFWPVATKTFACGRIWTSDHWTPCPALKLLSDSGTGVSNQAGEG